MNISKNILVFGFAIFFVFVQCCTIKNGTPNKEVQNENYQSVKSLPRGMVDLSCSILEVFVKDEKPFCTMKIIKVHGYGAGVRPLAESSKYEVEIDKKIFDEKNIKSKIGQTIRCKLQLLPTGMNSKLNNKMKLISIKES